MRAAGTVPSHAGGHPHPYCRLLYGRVSTREVNQSARMRERIDAPEGRAQYARRFGTVEPVFANFRANKQLDRCTLRGRAKVDTQWKRHCLVHNIEKLANTGDAA